MNAKLRALYGLKWNPFISSAPVSALYLMPPLKWFCWRMLQLAGEGGFALISGAPGAGKSAALRILAAQMTSQHDLKVGIVSRPQASLADFYRELGDIFAVQLQPHNRWGGAKTLRQSWRAHFDSALSKPILLVDEAQEMQPSVLSELRLLASADLDARVLLTVVLAGDGRLVERLRAEEFLPLASRVRARLVLERTAPRQLQDCLRHILQEAGAPNLMTPEVIVALCDHAQGNLRALMIMADELLAAALQREARQIDQTLFFETCTTPGLTKPAAGRRR